MKLLIVLIAMGVIGVIGTVEYSHAQTPLTIASTNIPDAAQGIFKIYHHGSYGYYLSASNKTLHNSAEPHIGNIHIPSITSLQSNPILPTPNKGIDCTFEFRNIQTIINKDNKMNPKPTLPDNITPNNTDTIIAIGFDTFNGTGERDIQCSVDFEAITDGTTPIITTKELRFTIYGKHDKKAYYFSPRDNITQAQPIPLCSDENFNRNDQTLKGTNNMCYGKNGNDMVIMTKRLLGFYGAADSFTTLPNNGNNRDNNNPLILDGLISNYTAIAPALDLSDRYPILLGKFEHADPTKRHHEINVLPKCTHDIHKIPYTVSSLNRNGDIVITYTVEKSSSINTTKLDRPLLTLVHSNPANVSVYSLKETKSENSTHHLYTVTLDNLVISYIERLDPTHMDHIDMFITFPSPSNVISKDNLFSNSSSGEPLFFTDNARRDGKPIFIQLPTGHNAQFVSGTHPAVSGTVYVPSTDVTFDEPILCRYAMLDPALISELIDFTPTGVKSTDTGLEFTFDLSAIDSNRLPNKVDWIISNSTFTKNGTAADPTGANYVFTIPIDAHGAYNVTIRGIIEGEKELFGPHSKGYNYNTDSPEYIALLKKLYLPAI